jgi:hypothetical protein
MMRTHRHGGIALRTQRRERRAFMGVRVSVRALVSLMGDLPAIGPSDWRRRYALRMRQRLAPAWTLRECRRLAGCAEVELAESPEDAADEELSYWSDDG